MYQRASRGTSAFFLCNSSVTVRKSRRDSSLFNNYFYILSDTDDTPNGRFDLRINWASRPSTTCEL